MSNFNFWQKWLLAVGIHLSVFGFVLAFFNQTRLMDFAFNNRIDPVFWDAGEIPEKTALFQAWIYGVLGATVSGWGIFLAFLAYYPFRAREKWAWNCIAIGITTWFVVDTAISVFFQVTFNAIFNTTLLLLVGIPLLFTRKGFSEQSGFSGT